MMHITFEGKIVIVTGAAHGFGRAIALAFAERGAIVYGCDILADELAETHSLCEAVGGVCHVATVDVRDRGAVFAFVDGILETHAQVDILVNNAGGVLGQVGRPLETISQDD
ncbi:MAG: SDR family NAD(P)-dependent oxidoreductase [Chloroflexota bacterium]